MPEMMIYRTPDGQISPADEESLESFNRLKVAKVYRVKWSEARKYKFHRRVFALLKFAYENTEKTSIKYKGTTVVKSEEQFRKEAIILAGFYTYDIAGRHIRYIADSISYEKCTQEKIEKIYDKLLSVVGVKIFNNGYSREELERLSNEWVNFL